MREIQNPILRGFNPDPSIIRVEEDYYIATSTFEWFSGVQIHRSTDLVNWNVISHTLNEVSPNRIEFNNESLDINFQFLRIPVEEHWCSVKERKRFLRLRGRESLSSIHEQNLVAHQSKTVDFEWFEYKEL